MGRRAHGDSANPRTVSPVTDLLELPLDQLRDWFAQRGLPSYRAGQVWKWIFHKQAASFDAMTDLPASLRNDLAAEFRICASRVVRRQQADDGTIKLLLELHDAQRIECVLLCDDKQRRTACISTQVGCAMGCAFCATGLDGFVRNLAPAEILEQLLHLKKESEVFSVSEKRLPTPFSVSVVVMGMGEPLLNLDALLPALAAAGSRQGLGIGARRITISTVGLPEGIRRLARENCAYHLAVSLHAADDALRNRLVPANRKFGVQAIVAAADEYFQCTGRRVTYEYVLLAGVNDQPDHAQQLVALLRGRPALINLILYNPVQGLPYQTPSAAATKRFVAMLAQGGLNAVLRHRKGDRIDAACGQLRRRAANGENPSER